MSTRIPGVEREKEGTSQVRRLVSALILLATGAAGFGCGESPTGPSEASSLVVSSASGPVAYLSLRPGSVRNGSVASVRVARTGRQVQIEVFQGGFDPVAVEAAVGDTLEVTVQTSDGSIPERFSVNVPRPTRPVIVRTYPPRSKRDVPLNGQVMVVFSEPLSPSSLMRNSLHLRSAGGVVSGRLEFTDSTNTGIQFIPSGLLQANTDYQLVITQAVTDLDGMTLDGEVSVPFTTGADAFIFSVENNLNVVQLPPPYGRRVLLEVTVTARHATGEIATEFDGEVTLALAPHSTGGSIWIRGNNNSNKRQAVNGIARFDSVQLNAIGQEHMLMVTTHGFHPSFSPPFDAGGTLVFRSRPTVAYAGVSIPPVEIMAVDSAGLSVQTFQPALYLTLAATSPPIALTGTRAVAAARGLAVFTDLVLAQATSDSVQFTISGDGFRSVSTPPFPVYRTSLRFSSQPSRTLAGAIMDVVKVTTTDEFGTVLTRFSGDVTLRLAGSSSGAILTGTRTVRAFSGVATFTNLQIIGSGSGHQLIASATPCCIDETMSVPFDVVSSQLVFTSQPQPRYTTNEITPALRVAAQNSSGNTDISYRDTITIALGNNPTGAILSGTASAVAQNGVATFPDLKINTSGVGYTLVASSRGAMGTTSSPFTVATPWNSALPMITSRSAPGVAMLNGLLFVAGGDVERWGQTVNTVEVYNPSAPSWTPRAPMITPRADFGMGVVRGTLYAIGGRTVDYTPTALVEAYDPSTNRWTQRAAMPTARYGLTVAVVDGILYAIGEQTPGYFGEARATVEAYDPATNQWTTKASMPTARANAAVEVVNGLIYAMGGYNDAGSGVERAVESYNPATNSWAIRAPMVSPRSNTASAVVNGIIFVIAGWDGNTPVDGVTAYDPNANTWATMPGMPVARFDSRAVTIGGIVHVVGGTQRGGSVSTPVSDHHTFTP